SQYITDLIVQRFPTVANKSQAVRTGVDSTQFKKQTKRSEPPRILFVGRISPEKGVHLLLEAFGQVTTVYPQAQLDIIGPYHPAPYAYLAGLSNDPNVQALARFYDKRSHQSRYYDMLQVQIAPAWADNVHFWGEMPHDAVALRLAEATMLVNPSLSEAFGNTIIEGMVCGLPVIATDVGGMVESVDEGRAGLLLPPNNANRLAEGILSLLSNDEQRERLASAGYQRACSRYSWEACAEILQNQINGLY
ncbi:MAG: glycosyltransferase family 4 protein, partial [Chloroflexota bacterium]